MCLNKPGVRDKFKGNQMIINNIALFLMRIEILKQMLRYGNLNFA